MRWVAAITACLVLGLIGASLSLAAPASTSSVDAEVEATLDHLVEAELDR